MKKWKVALAAVLAAGICAFALQAGAVAKGNGDAYIQNGIFIGDIDVSGMSMEEATAAVQGYVDGLRQVPITLNAVGGNQVTVTAGDMGIQWKNQNVLEEAFSLGKQGNIIRRYKELKDLEKNTHKYDLEFTFDQAALQTVLTEQCAQFDVEAEDA